MESVFVTIPTTKPTTLFLFNKPSLSPLHNNSVRSNNSLRISAVSAKKTWEPSKVAPQADRVLIRVDELPNKSAGGVLLPTSAVKFDRYLMGEILSIGPDVKDVEVGKKVLLSDLNAYEVDLGTEGRHCFCKAGELLALVE